MLQAWIGQWQAVAAGMWGGTHGQNVGPMGNRFESNEWEITEEIAMANLGGPIETFIERSKVRWQKGVDEYRGGDASAPFTGDPLDEAQDECCDIYAYAKQAVEDGLIDEVTGDQLNCLAFDAYKLLVRAKLAIKNKEAAAKKREQRDGAAKKAGLVIESL